MAQRDCTTPYISSGNPVPGTGSERQSDRAQRDRTFIPHLVLKQVFMKNCLHCNGIFSKMVVDFKKNIVTKNDLKLIETINKEMFCCGECKLSYYSLLFQKSKKYMYAK